MRKIHLLCSSADSCNCGISLRVNTDDCGSPPATHTTQSLSSTARGKQYKCEFRLCECLSVHTRFSNPLFSALILSLCHLPISDMAPHTGQRPEGKITVSGACDRFSRDRHFHFCLSVCPSFSLSQCPYSLPLPSISTPSLFFPSFAPLPPPPPFYSRSHKVCL